MRIVLLLEKKSLRRNLRTTVHPRQRKNILITKAIGNLFVPKIDSFTVHKMLYNVENGKIMESVEELVTPPVDGC